MRVVVGKIEGVRSVKVSLKAGVATVDLAPTNRVTLARIRDAIRSNGFTPREADVRMRGALGQRGDTATLLVAGTNETFVLQDAPGAAGTVAALRRQGLSRAVVVSGQIPRPPTRRSSAPERLLVRSFTPDA